MEWMSLGLKSSDMLEWLHEKARACTEVDPRTIQPDSIASVLLHSPILPQQGRGVRQTSVEVWVARKTKCPRQIGKKGRGHFYESIKRRRLFLLGNCANL